MLKSTDTPVSLADACAYFADQDNALRFLAELRWPDGVKCPHCQADDPGFLKSRRIWKCRKCRKQFSIKVGTIFEDSPLGLDKWLPALWMLANAKNGVSSYEVARALHVTQKTAWFMLGRIRAAMAYAGGARFDGEVEVDETFLGGAYRNMHPGKRARLGSGDAGQNKVQVTGILQRGKGKRRASQVRLALSNQFRSSAELFGFIHRHVKRGTHVYTDQAKAYGVLANGYAREVVNHAVEYVRGRVHTT